MHPYMIWNIGPPLRCSIFTGCLCLLFKAFFILSMYWLIRVLPFHSDVSAMPILGCPRWLLLSIFSSLTMLPNMVLLDSSWKSWTNHPSPRFAQELSFDWLCVFCQHPSRGFLVFNLILNCQSVMNLPPVENNTLQVYVIISLLGNYPIIQTCIT